MRKPTRIFLLAVTVANPAMVLAKPVYLTCDFTFQGRPQPRKLTLDEERGTATIYYPETAEGETVRAQFTDTIVVFENYAQRYGVNRVSLTGVRQTKVNGGIEEAPCRIEEPVKRAF